MGPRKPASGLANEPRRIICVWPPTQQRRTHAEKQRRTGPDSGHHFDGGSGSTGDTDQKPGQPKQSQHRTHQIQHPASPDRAQAEEVHANNNSDPGHGEPVSIRDPIDDYHAHEQGHHLNGHYHPVTTVETTRHLPGPVQRAPTPEQTGKKHHRDHYTGDSQPERPVVRQIAAVTSTNTNPNTRPISSL